MLIAWVHDHFSEIIVKASLKCAPKMNNFVLFELYDSSRLAEALVVTNVEEKIEIKTNAVRRC